jgi:ABC-2 type transport system permease protein
MNPTIAFITARGLFGRRRFLLLVPLPVLLIAMAAFGAASSATTDQWGPPVIVGLGLTAVLPLIALIVGTGVLGSEIDDGTLTHILAKPLPRSEILLTKLGVAAGITAAVSAVPLFVAGMLTGSTALAFGLAVAATVGALTYSALFVAMSLLTRRPVLLGLLYVVLWEGLLGNLVSGTRVLSIQKYVEALGDWLAPSNVLTGNVSVTVSLIMAGVFTVGFTILAIRRLQTFSVAGETG